MIGPVKPARWRRLLARKCRQGQVLSVKVKDREAAAEYNNRETEKLAVIVHGRYRDPKLCYMAKNGPAHDSKGQNGAVDGGPGHEQQHGCNEFDHTATDPAPRLCAKCREDIDRLAGAGKFE